MFSYLKNIYNKKIFQPDSDAVTEALEMMKNNELRTMHSYDAINDQENKDLQSQIQDESSKDSFNNQPPEHLGSQTDEQYS